MASILRLTNIAESQQTIQDVSLRNLENQTEEKKQIITVDPLETRGSNNAHNHFQCSDNVLTISPEERTYMYMYMVLKPNLKFKSLQSDLRNGMENCFSLV